MIKNNISSKTECGPLAKNICDLKKEINKKYNRRKLFINIPYLKYYKTYEQIIYNVLKLVKLIPEVAKAKIKSGSRLCKICEMIKTCKYGISDLTGKRLNIAYELGIMHGIGRKILLIGKSGSRYINFTDTLGLEVIPYKDVKEFEYIIIAEFFSEFDLKKLPNHYLQG